MYNHITSHITSHLPISECLPGEEAHKDTMVNRAKSNTLKTQIARQRKDNLMAQAVAHYQAEKAKALGGKLTSLQAVCKAVSDDYFARTQI
jgi:hypothetical protein